jgi:hypothetical protein
MKITEPGHLIPGAPKTERSRRMVTIDAADELITPDRPAPVPDVHRGVPDLSFRNEHMVAESDLVAGYNLMRA